MLILNVVLRPKQFLNLTKTFIFFYFQKSSHPLFYCSTKSPKDMEDETTGNSHHIINNITKTFDHINNNNNCHNINDNNNNNNWSNTNNLKNVSIEIFEDLDPNFCQVFGQDLTNNPSGSDFHKTGNDNPGFKLQICLIYCIFFKVGLNF